MGAPFSCDTDTTGLNEIMGGLYDALISNGQHGDAATLTEDETRLALKQLIKITPPKNHAQGRAAIAGDLLGGRKVHQKNATGVKNSRGIFVKISDWMPIKETEEHVTLFVTKDGYAYGADRRNYRPDATVSELKAFHRSRTSVNASGRIRVSLAGSWTRDIGRWREFQGMTARRPAIESYVASVQARVGRFKGNWAHSYILHGGKVPSWISRHLPSPNAIHYSHLTGEFPSIVVGSISPGGETRRLVRSVIRIRKEAMERRARLILSGYAQDVAQGRRPRRKVRPDPGSFTV